MPAKPNVNKPKEGSQFICISHMAHEKYAASETALLKTVFSAFQVGKHILSFGSLVQHPRPNS